MDARYDRHRRAPNGAAATCLAVFAALTAAAAPAGAQEAGLEQAFWMCDFVATVRGVGAAPVGLCGAVTEAVKNERFGGDFGRMLRWWRQNKPTEHRRLTLALPSLAPGTGAANAAARRGPDAPRSEPGPARLGVTDAANGAEFGTGVYNLSVVPPDSSPRLAVDDHNAMEFGTGTYGPPAARVGGIGVVDATNATEFGTGAYASVALLRGGGSVDLANALEFGTGAYGIAAATAAVTPVPLAAGSAAQPAGAQRTGHAP